MVNSPKPNVTDETDHVSQLDNADDAENANNANNTNNTNTGCGKGCIAALTAIMVFMIWLLVFYEPTPTAGDMCKIYG